MESAEWRQRWWWGDRLQLPKSLAEEKREQEVAARLEGSEPPGEEGEQELSSLLFRWRN